MTAAENLLRGIFEESPSDTGVHVTTSVSIDWCALGEHLAGQSDEDQANLLCAFAEMLHRPEHGSGAQTAYIAGVVLAWEKDDSEARVSREALQRFCRELLEHLDEGSR